MTHFKINKPLRDLPPLTAKPLIITSGGRQTVDFLREFNAVCVGVEIHNRKNQPQNWRINEIGDLMTLEDNIVRRLENVHIYHLDFLGTGDDIALFCTLAPVPLLKRYNAVENA